MNPNALQLACSTCANSFQEAGGNAAGWAIMFLLVVIVLVLGGVGFCMTRIARRENAALDPQFCDE
jgi:hypothetical protein